MVMISISLVSKLRLRKYEWLSLGEQSQATEHNTLQDEVILIEYTEAQIES